MTPRFKKPTDSELIIMAISFNNDSSEPQEKIVDMVAMCQFVLDRLYENGDITVPCTKEIEIL